VARVVSALVRLALLGATAFALYALWLVDRLDISRETIERRARSVETNVVPSLVGGAQGRSFDAQLEFPLYLSDDRIPDFVKNAIVASEDQQFWWHPGVNPIALARATYANATNWWRGTGARSVGASNAVRQEHAAQPTADL
jgi:membrane peptidoglycan carboxypeptidase